MAFYGKKGPFELYLGKILLAVPDLVEILPPEVGGI
jgi:hypothetical protein